ncbi:MAG TPA: DUF3054 domain-containing protein [Ktedonobacterales bacterium]|jgi:hypothetical protein
MRLITLRQRPDVPTTATSRSLLAGRARIPALVIGDAAMFLLFAGVGRQSHHEASGLGALGQVAVTAIPFALGWFIVAPLLGAYRARDTATPGAMLRRTELAWLGAWPLTLLLRWAFTQRVPEWSFALVILVANALFLGAWRGAFAWVLARRGGATTEPR